MDAPSCKKDRVIQTFPWIFVVMFFISGFTSSLIGCALINHPSNIKFIPFIIVVVFEIVLASFVGLLKSYHLQILQSELFGSIKCYKSGGNYTPTSEEIDFDELNLKSMNYIQTTFNCCGVNSYEDWINEHNAVPRSCCAHMKFCSLPIVKQKIGCYEAVKMDVFSNWNAMIMFMLIFICIKLTMLIMYKCSEVARSAQIEIESRKDETIYENQEKKEQTLTSL